MKEFIFFARLYSWLLLACPLVAIGQEADLFPNYVVIGAFAYRENAVNFTDEARHQRLSAQFEMNANRNLYYVYVLTTANRDIAIAEAVRLRAETKYFDTWVYSGALGALQLARADPAPGADIDPVTGAKMDLAISSDIRNETEAAGPVAIASALAVAGPSAPAEERSVADVTAVASAAEVHGPKRTTEQPLQSKDVVGKNLYFHLFRGDNGKTVAGEVDAIDFERSRKMATYPANESVSVSMPSGESNHISFICQVFGYRKQQKEFDPANPDEEFYLDDTGNVVVPFELVRLQKGDIAIMYNVFFFKDAAVMRPESRYEVNNLLELLQENPSYKIRIHGHTNGNARGKIIRMDTPDNFYTLTGTRQGFGSAKKLSEERAEVIRAFLIHSGIAEDRMTIKAWGGKRPIHDPNSVRAVENVRVEIEILSD